MPPIPCLVQIYDGLSTANQEIHDHPQRLQTHGTYPSYRKRPVDVQRKMGDNIRAMDQHGKRCRPEPRNARARKPRRTVETAKDFRAFRALSWLS